MLSEGRRVPIRRIRIVIDVEDYYSPPVSLEDFREIFDKDPEPPRYRIVTIETVVCPEDMGTVLVTECARCPRFIRRTGEDVICTYY